MSAAPASAPNGKRGPRFTLWLLSLVVGIGIGLPIGHWMADRSAATRVAVGDPQGAPASPSVVKPESAPGPPQEKTAGKPAPDIRGPDPRQPKLGLIVNDPKASPGYTLLAPSNSPNTYLIDIQGRVVRAWRSHCNPGLSAYLLENGNLLRTGQVRNPPFFGGGSGGRIQEFDWDGQLVWDFTFVNPTQLPNHDICKLPNGNVLMIVWTKKTPAEAAAAGRRPETVGKDHLLAGSILEVQPTGKTTGKVVWEWHAWDRVVQDFDSKKANYGNVAAHPELIDLNFGEGTVSAMAAKPKELEKLRSIGYVGDTGGGSPRVQPDWLHINSVAYNAALDQIMLSVYEFNEIWIIDHGTTTAQSAGHEGGRYGKGGDLLYRWGNPRAHRAGAAKDQKLFGQHDAHWIAKGLPGEGHVLIFNNGLKRPGNYSSVEEIILPVDATGRYAYTKGKPFAPDKPAWSYAAPNKTDFYAPFISGAQRQPNGNTLVCSGTNGTVFEVTSAAEIVWKYVNPVFGGPPPGGGFFGGAPPDGAPFGGVPFGGAPPGGAPFGGAPFGGTPFGGGPPFGGMPFGATSEPGQLMSASVQDRLKLTDEQKKQLAALQKEAEGKLDTLLQDEQKKEFKQIRDAAKGSGGGGGPFGFPAGGFPGFGAPGGGGVFRAPRYALDYPGLAGKPLVPGKTVEEMEAAGGPGK